jgi:hypothetical protein
MARKSKRHSTPRPPRFTWNRSNAIKLIACLDYSLQQKVDFINTTIGHIARRTGKEVTERLIQQGLKNEYKTYGRSGENDSFNDFLAEGSTFLVGYSDSDHQTIREEISHIEPPRNRYLLKCTPLESRSQSRTISSNHYQASETSSTLSIHATPEFEGVYDHIDQIEDTEKQKDEKEVRIPGHFEGPAE